MNMQTPQLLYRRLRFGLAAFLVFCVAGCASIRFDTPGNTAPTDWLTEGDSNSRIQRADISLPPPLVEAWSYNAGAGFGRVSPLLLQDAVIVATRKGEVHAIDWESGKKRGLKGFGESIEGTPVVAGDHIFVPVAWGRKVLHAYDLRTGRARWVKRDIPVEAGLLVNEGSLLVADIESNVRALNLQTGEEQWVWKGDSKATIYAAPVLVRPDLLVVADEHGLITGLDPLAGKEKWQIELELPVLRSFAAKNDKLYISTPRGTFIALDANNGNELWRYTVRDSSVRFSSPAVSDDAVFFGSTEGNVLALNRNDGSLRWRSLGEEALSATPLVTDGYLFIGTLNKQLLAIDMGNGERVWEHELKGRVKSAMAAKDGGLVVLAEPRIVYKFTQAEEATYAAHDE